MTKSFQNKNFDLVFACEHGGHQVPSQLKYLEKYKILDTKEHWAWDPGALETTQFLSQNLNVPYFANPNSRLLIDCNRSDDNPDRFPNWTKKISQAEKEKIERLVSHKYKTPVRRFVSNRLNKGRQVIMISVHSFVPVLKGKTRKTELGVLYRPWCSPENELAGSILGHLRNFSEFKVHANLPYRGHTDCFLNELSTEFKSPQFFGIMFELNCGLQYSQTRWKRLQWDIAIAVNAVLGG